MGGERYESYDELTHRLNTGKTKESDELGRCIQGLARSSLWYRVFTSLEESVGQDDDDPPPVSSLQFAGEPASSLGE